MDPRWRRFLWPDWQRRKRMLRVEAWVVVFASYALLLLAWLWRQDYRNESPAYVLVAWLAFLVRVLQFHLGLLLLAIAVAAAFVRGKRLFLAAAPLVLFTLAPAWWGYLRPAPRVSVPPGQPVLRVMSVNLLMVNRQTEGIIGEIKAARPDVLVLQEYAPHWHQAIAAALSAEYPWSSFETRDDSFGVAVYSRTPFVNGDVYNRVPLGREAVPQARAVVRFGGRDVAVYNVHLLPPRSLQYTVENRLQFADLLDTLSKERLPYVVAGDWNLTQDTPQHRDLLRIGARDAQDLVARGRGATWPVNSVFRYLPGLRLDHVYMGPGLTAVRCERGVGEGSDHRPVIVDVTWSGGATGSALPGPAPGRAGLAQAP
jgi:endonuclease/exonuclease/phosphatase (EEP) superfamily protein YafD